MVASARCAQRARVPSSNYPRRASGPAVPAARRTAAPPPSAAPVWTATSPKETVATSNIPRHHVFQLHSTTTSICRRARLCPAPHAIGQRDARGLQLRLHGWCFTGAVNAQLAFGRAFLSSAWSPVLDSTRAADVIRRIERILSPE
jgi:hypothetical protein